MLDEALLRPGRLEVQIEIGLPDQAGRHQILKIHTSKVSEDTHTHTHIWIPQHRAKQHLHFLLDAVSIKAANQPLSSHADKVCCVVRRVVCV